MKEEIKNLEERIKDLKEQHENKNYYGKLSDLSCEINQLEVKLFRLKEKK